MWPNWSVSGPSPTPPQPQSTAIKQRDDSGGGGSGFNFSEPFRIQLKPKNSILLVNSSSFTFEKPPVRLNGIVASLRSSIIPKSTQSIASKTVDQPRRVVENHFSVLSNSTINEAKQQQQQQAQPATKQRAFVDSSSNSILAALKSLGPSSKLNSIFIKPKGAKHIEQSAFYVRKHQQQPVNSSEDRRRLSSSSLFESGKLISILPDEPNEIRLNESVEELLKRFSNETTSSSLSSSSISSDIDHYDMDTSSDLVKSGMNRTSLFNYKAKSKVKNVNETSSSSQWPSNTITSATTGNSSNKPGLLQSKWTCLVCLSKHVESVNVCSICGSSKPSSSSPTGAASSSSVSSVVVQLAKNRYANLNKPRSTTTLLKNQTLFSNYLLNQLGLTNRSNDQASVDSKPTTTTSPTPPSQPSQSNPTSTTQLLPNPYLRRWTCRYCHFSNDSLKIVCLNCRWVKTCPTDAKTSPSTSLVSSPSKMAVVTRLTGGNQQTTPKTEEEATQTDDDVCATCKTPIKEAEKKKTEEKSPQTAQPSLAQLFGAKKTTWSCDTCLASNPESTNKCACCATARPGATTVPPTTTAAPVLSQPVATSTAAVAPSTTFSFPKPAAIEPTPITSTTIDKTSQSSFKPFFQPPPLPQVTEKQTNGEKPSSIAATQPSTTTTTTAPSQPLPIKDIFSSQKSKWTCNTCLVANDQDKTKCVACMSDKPSSTSGEVAAANTKPAQSTTISTFGSGGLFGTGSSSKPLVLPTPTQLPTTTTTTSSTVSTNLFGTQPTTSTTTTPFQFPKPPTTTQPTTNDTTGGFKLPAIVSPFPISADSSSTTTKSLFNLPSSSPVSGLQTTTTTTTGPNPTASLFATNPPFNLTPTPSGFKFPSTIPTTTTTTPAAPSPFTIATPATTSTTTTTATATEPKKFSFFGSSVSSSTEPAAKVTFGGFPTQATSSTAASSSSSSSLFNPASTSSSLVQQPQTQTTAPPPNVNPFATAITSSGSGGFSFGNTTSTTTTTTTATPTSTTTSDSNKQPVPQQTPGFTFSTGTSSLFQAQKRTNSENISGFSPSKTSALGSSTGTPTPGSLFQSTFMSPITPSTGSSTTTTAAAPSSSTTSSSFLLNTPAAQTTSTTGSTGLLFGGTSTGPGLFGSGASAGGLFPTPANATTTVGVSTQQQPKFNFEPNAFNFTPQINFTSTNMPFQFSGAAGTDSNTAAGNNGAVGESRKIRRAVRRNR